MFAMLYLGRYLFLVQHGTSVFLYNTVEFVLDSSGHYVFSADSSGHYVFSADSSGHYVFSADSSGHYVLSAERNCRFCYVLNSMWVAWMLLYTPDFVLNVDFFLFPLIPEDGMCHLGHSHGDAASHGSSKTNQQPTAVYCQTRMSMLLLVNLILTFCCLLHCSVILRGCISPKLGKVRSVPS